MSDWVDFQQASPQFVHLRFKLSFEILRNPTKNRSDSENKQLSNLLSKVKMGDVLTQEVLFRAHQVLFPQKKRGYRTVSVWINKSRLRLMEPSVVSSKMAEWIVDANQILLKKTAISDVLKISDLLYRFFSIHPFEDGNGRLARFLISWILVKKGLPPLVLHPFLTRDYVRVLLKLGLFHQHGKVFPLSAFQIIVLKLLNIFLFRVLSEASKKGLR